MQQRRGACTSGREREEEERFKRSKRFKERERIKRSVQKKADARVTMASAANTDYLLYI